MNKLINSRYQLLKNQVILKFSVNVGMFNPNVRTTAWAID